MEYRTLGGSGAVVSSYAIGTMTFGVETPEEQAHAQLDTFLEAGGTFVDTADVYGGGVSEEIVGRWLSTRPAEVRDRVVLATKGRFPTGPGPNDLGLSRRHLRRALEDSLRRLGVDHIDLYQVHAWDPWTPPEEWLRFLDDAVRAGRIGYPGLSNLTGWQVQKVVDIADFGGLARPVTLQPQYNLLVRELEWEIVPSCQDAGLGMLPWSPLGGGWLTGKYRRDAPAPDGSRMTLRSAPYEHLRTDAVYDAIEALERRGDPATLALAWLLADERVSVVLGPRRSEHLRPGLAALENPLSPEERDAIADEFRLAVES